jgi:pimeloyl-ACP methyl ester carboxylesterase
MANINVVQAHGASADGSSWARVITALRSDAVNVIAAALPLTSLPDDVAALERSIARTQGPVVLVGHTYAGTAIAEARSDRIKALVYVRRWRPMRGRRLPTRSTASRRIQRRQSSRRMPAG